MYHNKQLAKAATAPTEENKNIDTNAKNNDNSVKTEMKEKINEGEMLKNVMKGIPGPFLKIQSW